jgi:hypothetical protein
MRSRFWMGGRHVSLRSGKSLADKALKVIAERQLPELYAHCGPT